MRLSLPLLALTVLALLAAASWPRTGQPVLLAFGPGISAAPALAQREWRVVRIRMLGPVTLVMAAPDTPGEDPFRLRQVTGALLVTHAAQQPGCAATTRRPSPPWT